MKLRHILILFLILFIARVKGQNIHPNWDDNISGTSSEAYVYDIEPYNGNFIVAGDFFRYNTENVEKIALINPQGQFIDFFNIDNHGFDYDINEIYDVEVLSTGEVVIVGDFEIYSPGNGIRNILKFDPSGEIDFSFDPLFIHFDDGIQYNRITSVGVDLDDNITVAGIFDAYLDSDSVEYSAEGIAQIDVSGRRNASFNPSIGLDIRGWIEVNDIEVDDDGFIHFGGYYSLNNQTSTALFRLTPEGNYDFGFLSNDFGSEEVVESLLLSPDGNGIYVGGSFHTVNGEGHGGIVKLNNDGSIDPQFDVGTGFGGSVRILSLAADNSKIGVGGYFYDFDGKIANHIKLIRLNGEDTGINASSGPDGSIMALAPTNDGFMVGGGFFSYNCKDINSIIRVDTLDVGISEITTNFVPQAVYCQGESISIDYSIDGQLCAGNSFQVLLSDSAGSFEFFHDITNPPSNTADSSGVITARIPGGIPYSEQYRIMIVSSHLLGESAPTVPFAIKSESLPGSIVGDVEVCPGASGLVYTAPSVIGASYDWYVEGDALMTLVSGQSTNQIIVNCDANFSGGGYIELTYGSQCGDFGTSSIGVDRVPIPLYNPGASITSENFPVCQNTPNAFIFGPFNDVDYYVWNSSVNTFIENDSSYRVLVQPSILGRDTIEVIGYNECDEPGPLVRNTNIDIRALPTQAQIFPDVDTLYVCDRDTLVLSGTPHVPSNSEEAYWSSGEQNVNSITLDYSQTAFNGWYYYQIAEVEVCSTVDSIFVVNSVAQIDNLTSQGDYRFCIVNFNNEVLALPVIEGVENAYWTTISGNVSFDDSLVNNTPVSDAKLGANLISWNVENPLCASRDTVQLYWDEIIYAGEDTVVCGDSIVLNAHEPHPLYDGEWRIISSNSTNASFSDFRDPHATLSGLSPGIDTLIWGVLYCGNDFPIYDTIVIESRPVLIPYVDIQRNQFNYCEDSSLAVQVTDYNAVLGSPAFQWFANGVEIVGATDTLLAIDNLPVGDYQLHVRLTQNYECATLDTVFSDSVAVIINPNVLDPLVQISRTPNGPICPEELVVVEVDTMSDAVEPSFEWFVNGTQLDEFEDSINVQDFNDGDTIAVRVSFSENCYFPDSAWSNELIINHFEPISEVTLLSGDTVPCLGSAVTYRVQAQNAVSYTWTVEGLLLTETTDSLPFTSIDSAFVISVYAQDTCGRFSDTLLINIDPGSVPEATIDVNEIPAFCAGDTIRVSATEVLGAEGYDWDYPVSWTLFDNVNDTTIALITSSEGGLISVAAFNSCGYADTSDAQTIPTPLPDRASIVNNDTVLCPLSSFVVSTLPVNNASGYVWDLPDGASAPNVGSGGLSDTNRIMLTMSDRAEPVIVRGQNFCGLGLADTLLLSFAQSPNHLGIIGEREVCNGEPNVDYQVLTPFSYDSLRWSVNSDATVFNEDSTIIEVDFGQEDTWIKLTLYGQCESREDSISVTTQDSVEVNAEIIEGGQSVGDTVYVCPGHVFSYVLNYTGAGDGEVTWYINGLTASSNDSLTYDNWSSLDVISAEVVSTLTCSINRSARDSIVIIEGGELDVSLIATDDPEIKDTIICEGDQPQLEVSIVDGRIADAITWYLNDQILDETSASLLIKDEGAYRAELALGACLGETDTFQVVFDLVPDLEIVAQDIYCTNGGDNPVIHVNDAGLDRYVWALNNEILQDGTDTSLQINKSGDYALLGYTSRGCAREFVKHIFVDPSYGGYTGNDTVTFASVLIEVPLLDDSLLAVTDEEIIITFLNEEEWNADTVYADNGRLHYVPKDGFSGFDPIVYQISRAGVCIVSETVTKTIKVRPKAEADSNEVTSTLNLCFVVDSLLQNDKGSLDEASVKILDINNGEIEENNNDNLYNKGEEICIDYDDTLVSLTYVIVQDVDNDIIYSDTTKFELKINIDPNDITDNPDDYDGWDPGELLISNAMSPNGDTVNEYLHIIGIDTKDPNGGDLHSESRVLIWNKLGKIVFDTESDGRRYSNNAGEGVRFEGVDMFSGNNLPTGTYYYAITVPIERLKASNYETDDDKKNLDSGANENTDYRTYSGFIILKRE